ncbi:hypothetical protein EDC04DRAFT_1407568 [Pisolithus marmoratus]|nr:hypothetical protein EDC04DRAFT_1407568 [Pisolithus marmoratus]
MCSRSSTGHSYRCPTSRDSRRHCTGWCITSDSSCINHVFFIACMYILRSTYLPAYSYLIHLPYSGSIPMSLGTSFVPLDSTPSNAGHACNRFIHHRGPSTAWPADLTGRRIRLPSHLLPSPSPHLTTHRVPTWTLIFNPLYLLLGYFGDNVFCIPSIITHSMCPCCRLNHTT